MTSTAPVATDNPTPIATVPPVRTEKPPAGTYLSVAGGALCLLGVILFFAAAGFPPTFTTTYEYSSSGGASSSTSPGFAEIAIYVGMIIVGSILLRAARAAGSSRDA